MSRTVMLLSLAVAAVGGVMYALHLKHYQLAVIGDGKVGVIVLKTEVELGKSLTTVELGVEHVPPNFLEERHIRAVEMEEALGTPVTRPIQVGSWLTWDDVGRDVFERKGFSHSIPPGMRAFTFISLSQNLGRMVSSGDRVDVVLTATRPGSDTQLTTVLVQNVMVMAVGTRIRFETGEGSVRWEQGDRERRGAQYVTTAVDLREAAALRHATHMRGSLLLIVRNPDDDVIIAEVPVTTDVDLTEAEQRTPGAVSKTKQARPNP